MTYLVFTVPPTVLTSTWASSGRKHKGSPSPMDDSSSLKGVRLAMEHVGETAPYIHLWRRRGSMPAQWPRGYSSGHAMGLSRV